MNRLLEIDPDCPEYSDDVHWLNSTWQWNLNGMYQVAPDFVSNLWLTEEGTFIATIVSVMTVVGYLLARRMAVVEA